MTTVLKAVRELEKRKRPEQPPAPSGPDEDRRPWRPLALAVLAFAGGAAGVGVLFPARDARHVSERQAPAPLGGPRVAAPEPVRVPPLAKARAEEEAPWGRVEKRAPIAPDAARLAAPAPRAAALPVPPAAAQPVKPRREAPAREAYRQPAAPAVDAPGEPEVRSEPAVRNEPAARDAPPAPDEPAVRDERAAPDTDAGAPASLVSAPRVQVTSIVYSPDLSQRSVRLRIEGAPAVTLHEGESTSGVEVQLILRDAVYLRHGGNVFAVGAAR